MIRAVSRYTVEINKTNSPYFDRAICFVKPEYAQNDRLDLHREAHRLVAALDLGIDEKNAPAEVNIHAAEAEYEPRKRPSISLIHLLPLAVSALVGSGITLLLTLII